MHRREHHGFVDFFCLKLPKNFVRELQAFRSVRVSKSSMHQTELSLISVKIFFFYSAKKLRTEHFCFPENFCYRTNSTDKMGGITIVPQKSSASQCRKNSLGNTSVFWKHSDMESFFHREGISLFAMEKILSHGAENNRRGTLRCPEKRRVGKQFTHKKGISLFIVDLFCLKVPNKFVPEPFCVLKEIWYRKTSCKRRGYHYPPFKLFCLTKPTKFSEINLCSEKILVSKTFKHWRRGITVLSKFFWCLTVPKKP